MFQGWSRRNHPTQRKRLVQSAKGVDTLKKMEKFCRTKKNMFFPIRDSITEALWELKALKSAWRVTICYIEHFEYHLRDKMVQKIKKVRSPKKIVLDESTQTPPESEEWVEVPLGRTSAKRYSRRRHGSRRGKKGPLLSGTHKTLGGD